MSPIEISMAASSAVPAMPQSFERGVIYVTTTQEDAAHDLYSIRSTSDMSILDINCGAQICADLPEILCARYESSRADLVANAIRGSLEFHRVSRGTDSAHDKFMVRLDGLTRFVRAVLAALRFRDRPTRRPKGKSVEAIMRVMLRNMM